MGRFSRSFLVLFFLPLFFLPFSVSGQTSQDNQLQPRPATPALPAPGGTSRQIILDVQVTDGSGAAVRGLQKQDFTLLDDKQPKNILLFRAVDSGAGSTVKPTVEIVLVIDAINASYETVTYEREELKKFLLQNGGKLAQPVSLVLLTQAGAKMQNGSSRNGTALAALYDQYATGLRSAVQANGFYGALERFNLSIKTLTQLVAYEGTRPGRKLMIWFSPGWPMLSGVTVELSTKDSQQLFHSIVTTTTGLRQSRITLYSIDPLGQTDAVGNRILDYKNFLKGISSPAQATFGNMGLQVLAVHSGGRVLNSVNDLVGAIAECIADADSFYVLSFDGARADQAFGEYHALGITVDKPGTTARTSSGYYAQP
ncbi:MAG TPA: VWA domain-containing protein [Terriglobales bacterium]|jgi:VWFA-related protein|nr:VWA domain-containing protein [Terriglobales bacterium]